MIPKSTLNQSKSSKVEAPLSRQVEHQYRAEPEGDAKSEGTPDSQEVAQGRLAALDIDLEDKENNACCLPHRATKMGTAYWVANLVGAGRRAFVNRLPWRA